MSVHARLCAQVHVCETEKAFNVVWELQKKQSQEVMQLRF